MPQHLHLEPWYFIFVDIIYVGAIKNIGRVVTECSSYSFVAYMTAASFLVIMFSTRFGFDVFSHFYESRFDFYLPFIFFYNVGVILMAFFIEMTKNEGHNEEVGTATCQHDKGYYLGGCYQCKANSYGFAAGFILTRGLLILYHFYIWSNHQTIDPDEQDNDVDEALRQCCEEPNKIFLVSFRDSKICTKLCCQDRLLYTRGAAAGYQLGRSHHAVERKCLKVLEKDGFDSMFSMIVYAISAIIVAGGFNFNFPQPFWLLVAAIVESLGGLGKDRLRIKWNMWLEQSSDKDSECRLKEIYESLKVLYESTASFYQSRLFSFYMVVLGEAVLGLVIIPMVSDKQGIVACLTDLLFSYFIIFAVGYQYSIFTTTTAKNHAIVGYAARDWYIWLHVIAAYAILMASNAMEHIFDDTQLESCDSSEIDHNEEYANSLKLGIGLVTVWLCLVVLRMLHIELDKDNKPIVFGWHYGHFDLAIIIVVMVGHGIGSWPGLLPQNRLLVYHGVIAWIPVYPFLFVNIGNLLLRLYMPRHASQRSVQRHHHQTTRNQSICGISLPLRRPLLEDSERDVNVVEATESQVFVAVGVSKEEQLVTFLNKWLEGDVEVRAMIDPENSDRYYSNAARTRCDGELATAGQL